MHIHPWTNYEIARMHDEERLKLARAAMLSLEARAARTNETETDVEAHASSWLDRIRRRPSTTSGTPARSGTR
jgi:hypothetical protein